MKTIAIIGFGFSGTIFFLNLIKPNLPKNLNIIIFEKENFDSSNVNLGPAFSPFSDDYILNVKASNMSAHQDDKDDFVNFLKKEYPAIYTKIIQDDHNAFVARKIYGKYLNEIRKQALKDASLKQINYQIINQEVLSIKNDDQKLIITTKEENFKVDKIILATSLKQAELPFFLSGKNFIKNLWSNEYFDFHNQDLPQNLRDKNSVITLIGSGLSAIDVIIGLVKKNFSGKIIVMSRRGNFSKKHPNKPNLLIQPLLNIDDARLGILHMNLKIRKFLKQNTDFDLRNIITSIRPIIKELWSNLDDKNKPRFLKFLPYWNIFRHLAPSSSIDIIDNLIKNGRIKIKKATIDRVDIKGNKIIIYNKNDHFETDYLVNCLGFEMRAKKYPLFDSMIKNNLLKQDLIMVKSNNQNIYLLAALNIAQDFEITSVPDIRAQAQDLANKIAAQI
jgi:uncharacterized NAD(P)/FAD-binding protein YdhS